MSMLRCGASSIFWPLGDLPVHHSALFLAPTPILNWRRHIVGSSQLWVVPLDDLRAVHEALVAGDTFGEIVVQISAE